MFCESQLEFESQSLLGGWELPFCRVLVLGCIGAIGHSPTLWFFLVTHSTDRESTPDRDDELSLSKRALGPKSPFYKMRDLWVAENQEIRTYFKSSFHLVEGQGVKVGGGDRWGVVYSYSIRGIHMKSGLHAKFVIKTSDISYIPLRFFILYMY